MPLLMIVCSGLSRELAVALWWLNVLLLLLLLRCHHHYWMRGVLIATVVGVVRLLQFCEIMLLQMLVQDWLLLLVLAVMGFEEL